MNGPDQFPAPVHVALCHLIWKFYNFVKVLQFILKNERYNLGSKKIIIKNKTEKYNLCDEEEKIIFQRMSCL